MSTDVLILLGITLLGVGVLRDYEAWCLTLGYLCLFVGLWGMR